MVKERFIDTKKGKIKISQVNVEDAKNLIEFMKKVDLETDFLLRAPGEFNLTEKQEKEFIKKQNSDENSLFLKASLKNKVVATLGFSGEKNKRYSHKGEFGMAVLKEYWNLGIGSAFLNNLLKWADDNNLIKISLRVDATNEKAIGLYKKFGFEKEGLLKKNKCIGKDDFRDELVMAYFLENNL
ncbi:MAG: GNAT family N-acetyltransferase [Bacillota bacterium]